MENMLQDQKEISSLKDSLRDLRHERDSLSKRCEDLKDKISKSESKIMNASHRLACWVDKFCA